MGRYNTLLEYYHAHKLDVDQEYTDGALINPNTYPLKYKISKGAILFADLPNFTKLSREQTIENTIKYINRFYAWIEAEAINLYNGIVDKFIGDAIMIVFPNDLHDNAIISALHTAKSIIEEDSHDYSPKIGIAAGEYAICEVGTTKRNEVTVIGSTVNLAARCVDNCQSNNIKTADCNNKLIEEVFNDNTIWDIIATNDYLKGIGNIDTICMKYKITRYKFSKSDFQGK